MISLLNQISLISLFIFLGHSLQEVRTEVIDHVIKFTNCHWFRPILEAVLLAGRVLVETFFAQLHKPHSAARFMT